MPREPNSDAAAIWDMLEAAKDVVAFVTGRTLEQYSADRMLQAAIERKIEIIGEAARNISDTFRLAHPEIPWRPIVAQRHIIAHDYGEIIDEKIWKVATVYVRELIEQLTPLLPQEP